MIRLIIWLCLSFITAFSQPNFPLLSGVVVDNANLLSSLQKEQLQKKIETFHSKMDTQFVVVTLPTLDGYDIVDYGYQLGRHWGIGQKEKDNGVLLIVAPKQREVRIEVGYGLEGVLSDYLCSRIIQEKIIPHFKNGDMPKGIESGADAILSQLQNPISYSEKSTKYTTSGENDNWFFLSLVLISLSMYLQRFKQHSKIFRPLIPSSFVQFITLMLTEMFWLSLLVFIVVYFISYPIMKRMNFHSGGSSRSSSSYSSRSSRSSGGFRGGGGSFGGGGASGKW